MNEAPKKENFSEEEKQRVVSFFKILMQIDRKHRITSTAKQYYAKRNSSNEPMSHTQQIAL